MTPLKQLIKHDPDNGAYGDCHRTCIASLLNIRPEDVPHFCDHSANDWKERQRDWLASHGLITAAIPISGDFDLAWLLESLRNVSPGVPFILGGTSSLGCNHSVVVMDGVIASDPSGNGISGPCDDGWRWLELISVAHRFALVSHVAQMAVA